MNENSSKSISKKDENSNESISETLVDVNKGKNITSLFKLLDEARKKDNLAVFAMEFLKQMRMKAAGSEEEANKVKEESVPPEKAKALMIHLVIFTLGVGYESDIVLADFLEQI